MSLINFILYDYWEQNADPRSRGLWLCTGGPGKIIAIIALYLYFCIKLGPQLMKNYPPFVLREAMLCYNITTVLLNVYFFVQTIIHLNFGLELFNFKFPSRDNLTEVEFYKARLVSFYLWTKLFDLTDTIFFVLRKKTNQITGLHLYHHAVVPLLGWLVLKLAPTASCLGLFPLCNTFIHIIMYSYYALAALGPKVQRYLWWKRYITQLQLTQFVIYAIYSVIFLQYQEGYPVKFWKFVAIPQPILFFYMFYRFYRKSYNNNTRNNSCTEKKNLSTINGNDNCDTNNNKCLTDEFNVIKRNCLAKTETDLIEKKAALIDANNNNDYFDDNCKNHLKLH